VVLSGERDVAGKVAGALRQAGLEVDLRKIDVALESGYRIVSFADKASPYTLDVIFVDALRKNVGIVAGLSTFFQAPDDLVLAKLRMVKATKPRSRAVKDEEDVKAILEFTEVNLEAVKARAKRDGTLRILEDLLS